MFKKMGLIFVSIALFFSMTACNEDEKDNGEDKQEEKQEGEKEDKDAGTENLGSLGLTTGELTETWNSLQTEMEETGAYKIENLQVTNGEFKTDLSEGLIMEGLVDEKDEITKMSIIRKEGEDETLEQSVNEFANTFTAFYLLVAVTNKDEKLKEEDIGKVFDDLGLIAEEENEKVEGEATLNNVKYKVNENERGLILTAMREEES